MGLDDVKQMAAKHAFVSLDKSGAILEEGIEDDSWQEKDDSRPSYLYMELQSTSSFRDIDIDKMLEHTSLDDFMRGLYVNKAGQARVELPKAQKKEKQGGLLGMLTGDQEQMSASPQLYGNEQAGSTKEEIASQMQEESDILRQQALQSLRERRLRLKSSKIFSSSMKGKTASKVEEVADLESEEADREVIDLKADQTQD